MNSRTDSACGEEQAGYWQQSNLILVKGRKSYKRVPTAFDRNRSCLFTYPGNAYILMRALTGFKNENIVISFIELFIVNQQKKIDPFVFLLFCSSEAPQCCRDFFRTP